MGGVIFLHFVGGLACEAPCVWSVLCRAGVGGVLCAILTRQRVFGGVSHLSPVPACAPVIFLTVSAWGAVVIRVVPFMREGGGWSLCQPKKSIQHFCGFLQDQTRCVSCRPLSAPRVQESAISLLLSSGVVQNSPLAL